MITNGLLCKADAMAQSMALSELVKEGYELMKLEVRELKGSDTTSFLRRTKVRILETESGQWHTFIYVSFVRSERDSVILSQTNLKKQETETMNTQLFVVSYAQDHDVFTVADGGQIRWLMGDAKGGAKDHLEHFLANDLGKAEAYHMSATVYDLQHPDNTELRETWLSKALIGFGVDDVNGLVGLVEYESYDEQANIWDTYSHMDAIGLVQNLDGNGKASIIIDGETVRDRTTGWQNPACWLKVRTALRQGKTIIFEYEDEEESFDLRPRNPWGFNN